MKNKYIVIDTWNGDSYSFENGTHIKTFPTKKQALKFAKENRDHYIKEMEYTPYQIDNNVFGYGDEEIGNHGSFQVYELNDNDYAVEIIPNYNEVFILTKEQYKQRIKELNEEVFEMMYKGMTLQNFHAPTDIQEYIDIHEDINEPFYHGVNEYDYQFRIIN